jgi:DnaK suppressor protein
MNKKSLNFFRAMMQMQLDQLVRKSDGALSELLHATVRSADPVDRAALELERNLAVHMMKRDRNMTMKIQKALRKIDNGTFGICEECGEEIDLDRLKLRPIAELCIGCKKQQERMEKSTCEQD